MFVTIYVVFYYIHSEGRNTIFLEKQIYVVFCHNHNKERNTFSSKGKYSFQSIVSISIHFLMEANFEDPKKFGYINHIMSSVHITDKHT